MNTDQYCKQVKEKDLELKRLMLNTLVADNKSSLESLLDDGFDLIYEPSIKNEYKYLVREEIVEKIGRISRALLQQDKKLIIRSAWRSFDHQQMIWDNKMAYLKREHPEKSLKEIEELVAHFIAPSEKSMHSTGGAVDALIYDIKNDCVMEFGTNKGLSIDLNDKCFPYHPDISTEAKVNRKLLINLFEKEGFLCDLKEYWHFDYGNLVWATKKGEKEAFYGVVKRIGE